MADSTLKLVSITAAICIVVSAAFVWTGVITSAPDMRLVAALGASLPPLALGALGLLYRPNRGAGFMAVALGVLALMSYGAW